MTDLPNTDDLPGRLPLGWIAAGLLLITALAVGLWFFTQGKAAPNSTPESTTQVAGLEELAELTVGEEAEILAAGESAQERNALIPQSDLPVTGARAFTAISGQSPAYPEALRCLTQAVYYEAANESIQGKRGVAQVVLNRVRHPAYPRSVCGVVYEGVSRPVCQFSFTCDGSLLRGPLARQWADSRQVAEGALAGKTEPTVGTSTHYHADYVVPRWAYTLAKVGQIGRHIFYRFPGRGGSRGAFTAGWSGRERIPSIDYTALEERIAEEGEAEGIAEEEFVEGLTVTPDETDRHAKSDVGGRIDTTVEWRPSIPDPVTSSENYRKARARQGEKVEPPVVAETAPETP